MGKKSNGVVEVKPAVTLIVTASGGKIGPPIGLLDIGAVDGAYIFRVALPGEVSDLKFVIELVKGFVDNYPGDAPPAWISGFPVAYGKW